MDNLNMADMADEIAAIQQELDVEVDGVLFVDGVVEEVKTTKTDRKTPYARVRPFAKDAAAAVVLGVPMGRIKGVQVGQSCRFFVTALKDGIFQYTGHLPIATAALGRNAKPAPLQSKDDTKSRLEAAGKPLKANPKATL